MAGNQKLEIRITDMQEFVEVIDGLKEKLALWESATVRSEIRINAELLDKTQQVDRLEETIREQGDRIKALEDRNKIFEKMIKRMIAPMLAQGMFGEEMVEKVMNHGTGPKKTDG